MKRRAFLARSAALAGAAALAQRTHLLGATPTLADQTGPDVVPISDAERLARIEKAQRLMVEQGIDAMLLEGGTSMYYYTGVRWGNSERPFGVVIPARASSRGSRPASRRRARAS